MFIIFRVTELEKAMDYVNVIVVMKVKTVIDVLVITSL